MNKRLVCWAVVVCLALATIITPLAMNPAAAYTDVDSTQINKCRTQQQTNAVQHTQDEGVAAANAYITASNINSQAYSCVSQLRKMFQQNISNWDLSRFTHDYSSGSGGGISGFLGSFLSSLINSILTFALNWIVTTISQELDQQVCNLANSTGIAAGISLFSNTTASASALANICLPLPSYNPTLNMGAANLSLLGSFTNCPQGASSMMLPVGLGAAAGTTPTTAGGWGLWSGATSFVGVGGQ